MNTPGDFVASSKGDDFCKQEFVSLLFLNPFKNNGYYSRKEFATRRSKLYHFRITSIEKGGKHFPGRVIFLDGGKFIPFKGTA